MDHASEWHLYRGFDAFMAQDDVHALCCQGYFWSAGAWAFLIGSYLQLLEALNKHPMSVFEVFRSLWQRVEPDLKF